MDRFICSSCVNIKTYDLIKKKLMEGFFDLSADKSGLEDPRYVGGLNIQGIHVFVHTAHITLRNIGR